jgi:signal peptidase I
MLNHAVPAALSVSPFNDKNRVSPKACQLFARAPHPATSAASVLRGLSFVLASIALIGIPFLQAHGSVAMPQTAAFAEAYNTAQALAKDFPGSRVVTVASTYSMYPMLDWDSIVVIAPASLDQVKVGDVVCFRDRQLDGSHTILHRVERISNKDGRLVTRGDHLERADPHQVFAESLVGKAVYIIYFDRSGEQRPVSYAMAAPKRSERVVKLFRE